MGLKISFSLLLIVFFLVVCPVTIFAQRNQVTVVNDTPLIRKIAVHGQKVEDTQEKVTVDYQVKNKVSPHTYTEFELKEGSTIVHILFEARNDEKEFLKYPIRQWGTYSVSKMIEELQPQEDLTHLSW